MEVPMTSEQRVEIRMHVQGYDGDRTRQTTVTQDNRVLLNYITPEISGTAATHWRAVVERLAFFITEDEARETVVAKASEDVQASRLVEGLRKEVSELLNETMRVLNRQAATIMTLGEEVDALQASAKKVPTKKKPVKKVPARKRARK
jgi:hypothetical protein